MRNAFIIFVFAVFDTLWHGRPEEILRDGERYYQQYFIICRSASESCTGWHSHSHTSSRSPSRLMEWVIFTSCSLSLAYISKRLLIGFKLVNTCGELQFLIVWAKKFMKLFRNRTMGRGFTGMTWSVAHHMCSQAFNKSEDTNSRYWTGMVFWQIVGNECRLSLIM